MGCGFANPEAMQKMIEAEKRRKNEPPKPQLTVEEKNRKKMVAIDATREDGKRLFKAGKYKQALAVYERGVLICNGTYGLSDEEHEVMTTNEVRLDVNIATCHLKLKNNLEAIQSCKMALGIDKKCVKAFYRMSQAYHAMGEYAEALNILQKAKELDPTNKSLSVLVKTVEADKKVQKEKARRFRETLAGKLSSSAKREGKPKVSNLEQIKSGKEKAASTGAMVEQLERLAKLRQEGLLADEEYTAAKRKLIGL